MTEDRCAELLPSIRRIIRAVDLHSKALLKQYGLTGPQLMILTEIARSTDLSVSEIARHVSLSQATVTTILDRLAQQGFIVRKRGESDKRKVYIEASEKTRRILDSRPSLLQLEFVRRFGTLEDWEQSLIVSSFERVAALMDPRETAAAEPHPAV